jgi:hypothetical protein
MNEEDRRCLMARELDKKEIKILMDRWMAGDKGLKLNERVFILEKLVRNLVKAKKETYGEG